MRAIDFAPRVLTISVQMRPVTAVPALRSTHGRALLVALLAALAVPFSAMTGAADQIDVVNVIVSFRGHPNAGGKQAVKDARGQIRRTFQLIDAVSARMPSGRI